MANISIGKREKLIAGIVIAIVAIAAVHFVLFKGPARQLAQLKAERDSLMSQVQRLPKLPPKQEVDQRFDQIRKDEFLFWKASTDMHVMPLLVFYDPLEPPPPKGSDDKAKAEQEAKMAVYRSQERAYSRTREDIIAARFKQLLTMKERYEGGEEWVGDNLFIHNPPETLPTHVMKMTFLENNNQGWHLPSSLKKEFQGSPKLWDEINHLYEGWSLIENIPVTSSQYNRHFVNYQQRLINLGFPLQALQGVQTRLGFDVPDFIIRLLFAQLVWEQAGDETIAIGLDQTLTLPMLKKMFGVKTPETERMRVLNAQLDLLSNTLLPLARKNRIAEIVMVTLPTATDYFIRTKIEKGAAPTRTGGMAGGLGLQRPGGMGGAPPGMGMGMLARTRQTQQASAEAEGEDQYQLTDKGTMTFVSMRFKANNQNTFRFIYEVLNDPTYVGLEDLKIVSQQSSEDLLVQCVFNTLMEVDGLSGITTWMFDMNTLLPHPFVDADKKGQAYWRGRHDKLAKCGVDTFGFYKQACQEAGFALPQPEKKK